MSNVKELTLDGMMVFGKDGEGRDIADFRSYELGIEMEPFVARCKVQRMRDGDVYITRTKPRVRNKPMFRQDHSSLSRGRNGKYYFVFTMDEAEVSALPATLVKEANEAAAKLCGHFANY